VDNRSVRRRLNVLDRVPDSNLDARSRSKGLAQGTFDGRLVDERRRGPPGLHRDALAGVQQRLSAGVDEAKAVDGAAVRDDRLGDPGSQVSEDAEGVIVEVGRARERVRRRVAFDNDDGHG
jgi:hypothetical protein